MGHSLTSSIMLTTEASIRVIREDDDLDVEAYLQERRVGHAWCVLEGRRLLIADIRVDDRHLVRWPFCHNLLRRLGVPCRWVSFRGRGIGGRMLKRLLLEAEAIGVEEVWGSVVQSDIDRSPFLIQWYVRHGFAVTEPDGECVNDAVHKISLSMALPKTGSDSP